MRANRNERRRPAPALVAAALAALVAAALAAPLALAEPARAGGKWGKAKGAYAGFSLGFQRGLPPSDDSPEAREDPTLYGGFGGLRFAPNLSLELGWEQGSEQQYGPERALEVADGDDRAAANAVLEARGLAALDGSFAGTARVADRGRLKMFHGGALAHVPLPGGAAELLGFLGATRWTFERESSVSGAGVRSASAAGEDTGGGLRLGVGAQYRVAPRFNIRATVHHSAVDARVGGEKVLDGLITAAAGFSFHF